MTESTRRHDLSDSVWALLEAYLPGQSGQWGGVAKDNRQFINAVFWILRTGTLARFACELRRLEEYTPQILSLARPWCLGGAARTAHG